MSEVTQVIVREPPRIIEVVRDLTQVIVREPPRIIQVIRDVPRIVQVIARGPQGASSAEVSISNDENNRAEVGDDGGIFVADGAAFDPLAYYILAKN
jgi:hypothetical protein